MKRRHFWFAVGLIALFGMAAFLTRGMGFTSRANPSALEARVALAARSWAMPASARDRVNPVAASPEALKEGMAHWADHCATCHSNDGSGSGTMGKSFYPPAPDMRERRTQSLTDGELFYIIERGVPFTGMPAWGNGTPEGEQDSWKLVRFIRHLIKISATELEEMEAMNPKSPRQMEMEKHIHDFLKGKN